MNAHPLFHGSPAEDQWAYTTHRCRQREHQEQQCFVAVHLPGRKTVHSALHATAPATPEKRALIMLAKGFILIAFLVGG